MKIKNIFKMWLKVLIKPNEIFREEKEKSTLELGMTNMILSFIIIYFIKSIFLLKDLSIYSILFSYSPLFTDFISYVFIWFSFSIIIFLFSKLLKGKGNFEQQSYLISIFMAPLSILYSILSEIIGFMSFSEIISVTYYGLFGNVLTPLFLVITAFFAFLSTKKVHEFSYLKAALSVIIIFSIIFMTFFIGAF